MQNASTIYLDGRRLVVPNGYVFPPICLVTGETTGLLAPIVRRRVSNAHKTGLGKAVILATNGPIGLATAVHAATKDYSYTFRPSPRAVRRWKIVRGIGYLSVLLGVCMLFLGASFSSITLMVASFFVIALGFKTGAGFFDSVAVTKVNGGKLWLSGIPRALRERVVEIEFKRLEACRRAAAAQQQALAQQAA